MPWPYFIMKCGKDVENRTWRTDYHGRILIHVSKRIDTIKWWSDAEPPFSLVKDLEINWSGVAKQWCGHIVGSVELVDCVQNSNSKWAEQGMWHWVLKNSVLLKEPIPARGSLGLWEYEGELK
jgi:hypothetical protein